MPVQNARGIPLSGNTRIAASFILGCFLALAGLCAGELWDTDAFTPEDEYYLGRAVAASVLAVYRPWTENPAFTRYLNLICQSIAINSPLPAPFNGYHVIILDSDEFNAFATPGGHILISRGLAASAPSEDALAGLIAHELAHIQLRHGIQMIAEMRFFDEVDEMAEQARDFARRGSAAGQQAAEKAAALRASVSGIMDAFIKNGYSQEHEFAADAAAVQLLAGAGYDPAGLREMLEVLRRVQSSHSGGFNTTHPSPARRIAGISGLALTGGPENRSARKARFQRFFAAGGED
jgi:predicted Zn-dependent protease